MSILLDQTQPMPDVFSNPIVTLFLFAAKGLYQNGLAPLPPESFRTTPTPPQLSLFFLKIKTDLFSKWIVLCHTPRECLGSEGNHKKLRAFATRFRGVLPNVALPPSPPEAARLKMPPAALPGANLLKRLPNRS